MEAATKAVMAATLGEEAVGVKTAARVVEREAAVKERAQRQWTRWRRPHSLQELQNHWRGLQEKPLSETARPLLLALCWKTPVRL